jgi:hypothetical protein
MSTTSTAGERAKTTTATPVPEGLDSKIAYLTRVLKTPTIGRVWENLRRHRPGGELVA